MTDINAENKKEVTLEQAKVDNNVQQQPIETKKQEPPHQENKKTEEAPEDPNWRAFREARKKDRAEREAAERRAAEKEAEAAALKAAMEAAFAKEGSFRQQQQYPDSGNYPQEETEDERIEKKVQAALAAREAAYEKERAERERQEYPQRLNMTYPDFNHTITQDNLDYLDYHYPEISRPLQRLPDGFDKWSDIYKAIKRFIPNNTTAKKEAAKADANFNKPKSISSPSMIQPGEVTTSARITEEKRAANWERMQRVMKGLS